MQSERAFSTLSAREAMTTENLGMISYVSRARESRHVAPPGVPQLCVAITHHLVDSLHHLRDAGFPGGEQLKTANSVFGFLGKCASSSRGKWNSLRNPKLLLRSVSQVRLVNAFGEAKTNRFGHKKTSVLILAVKGSRYVSTAL